MNDVNNAKITPSRGKGRPFKRGNPGRPKGAKNKFTSLKQSFLDAFQDKDIGGTQGLIKVYKKNDMRKMEFFKLLTKLFPTAITGGDEEDSEPLRITFVRAKREEGVEEKK